MTSLLSLPRLPRKHLGYTQPVPAVLRARAGVQLRAALHAGVVAAPDLHEALAAGDAGVAALMHRHHVLRGELTVAPDPSHANALPPNAVEQLLAWARSLRAAKRLDDRTLAAIPQVQAWSALVEACVAAAQPSAPVAPRPCDGEPVACFAVSHSFHESAYSYGGRFDAQAQPKITVELAEFPLITLPSFADPDDATALRSAITAIANADPLGLLVPPQHALYNTCGWFLELLLDTGARAAKRADGSPIFTANELDTFVEEYGMDAEEDPQATCTALEAHYVYARALEAAPVWKPRSKPLRAWRTARAGSALGEAIGHLLDIAADLEKLKLPASAECEREGDPVALLLAERVPEDLYEFDKGLEYFGQSETPLLTWQLPAGASAAEFWTLHDRVLTGAALVTQAGNLVASIASTKPH